MGFIISGARRHEDAHLESTCVSGWSWATLKYRGGGEGPGLAHKAVPGSFCKCSFQCQWVQLAAAVMELVLLNVHSCFGVDSHMADLYSQSQGSNAEPHEEAKSSPAYSIPLQRMRSHSLWPPKRFEPEDLPVLRLSAPGGGEEALAAKLRDCFSLPAGRNLRPASRITRQEQDRTGDGGRSEPVNRSPPRAGSQLVGRRSRASAIGPHRHRADFGGPMEDT